MTAKQLSIFPDVDAQVIKGDCLLEMANMAEHSIDFIVTDPPYGLKFMGKQWDHGVPGIDFWKEAVRICKPGSIMAAFGGSRTHHRLMCAIEDAGWEIRDVVMYLYGSGFPKSHNHFGFEGYGTALKPAYEPIIIAMAPLEGTFKQNAQKWGVAGINIDESRVGIKENDDIYIKNPHTQNRGENKIYGVHKGSDYKVPVGRWPANLILDEEAAELLDEQTGILKSGQHKPHYRSKMEKCLTHNKFNPISGYDIPSNSGGASRFFYCAKASSAERNRGLEGKNIHCTVKPLSLMKYLLNLLAPPGDPIVLDPFCGSGSTLVAAKELGIRSIGIEKSEEYCEIARARIA